jgi:hypothetical protein
MGWSEYTVKREGSLGGYSLMPRGGIFSEGKGRIRLASRITLMAL